MAGKHPAQCNSCVHLHSVSSAGPPAAVHWQICLQLMHHGLRPAGGIRCVPAACDRIKLHTPEGKPKELLTCERCQHQPIWQPVSGQVPGKRPASAAVAAAAAAARGDSGPVACFQHPVAIHPSLDAARRYAIHGRDRAASGLTRHYTRPGSLQILSEETQVPCMMHTTLPC